MKWQNPEKCLINVKGYREAIRFMVSKIETKVLRGIEIGLGWGISAKEFLEVCPNAMLCSIDVNVNLEAIEMLHREFPARHLFENRNARNIILPSCEWLYIDGDHTYEGVKRDIAEFEPRLEVGGVIAFDDFGGHNPVQRYNYPGVTRAVSEFFNAEGERFRNFTSVHFSETGPLCAVKVA